MVSCLDCGFYDGAEPCGCGVPFGSHEVAHPHPRRGVWRVFCAAFRLNVPMDSREDARQAAIVRMLESTQAGAVPRNEARTTAEEKLAAFLKSLDDRTKALLFFYLRNEGWTSERTQMVLQKAGWWL